MKTATDCTARPAIFRATPADYATIVEIWESAVKATHGFLAQEDLEAIKAALPTEYFPAVELFAVRHADGTATAFAGIAGNMLEMLFVRNEYRGLGLGTLLLDFALQRGVDSVDVNEQNPQALGFYESHGFAVTSRDDTDAQGRPYPILHMSLAR